MKTTIISDLELEDGTVLRDVPVAYSTWGALNTDRTNAVLVCHSLTSNTDVATWWADLFGPGKVLNPERYFVICINVLGSCYGTAGPVTEDPATGRPYGPEFPKVTVRDGVRLHKAVLDQLDVRGVAFAIGGSMGGMQVLEWAFQDSFVRALVPIAVGPYHSAWCIGWSEAQRRAIYADPNWRDGRYDPKRPPAAGLAAARMMAMISYRSMASFEARFGREKMTRIGTETPPYAVESYLYYQGEKLVDRFDANTYVLLTQVMDTHDVARGRGATNSVLASIRQPTLVVGIESDLLYPLREQEVLAEGIPNAELAVLRSDQGHDAFLIETEQLNQLILDWLAHQEQEVIHVR